MLSHYHHQTLGEDTLATVVVRMEEKILMFQEERGGVLLRPLNQEYLHWLWQVEQAQTIRPVVAPLLVVSHLTCVF